MRLLLNYIGWGINQSVGKDKYITKFSQVWLFMLDLHSKPSINPHIEFSPTG